MVEINPITSVVVATPDAKTLFRDARSEADVMYHTERRAGNQAGMAVWARAVEQARKLAILGGASADFQNPRVTGPVAKWALALAWHQVKHSLWMAATCAVDNPFDGQCQRFKRLLRREKGEMLHWKLLKRMHLSSEDFRRVANTLIERGTVARDSLDTGGRPRIVYRTVRQ